MTTYALLNDVTVVQTLPVPSETAMPGTNLPAGSVSVDLRFAGAGNPTTPATEQSFQAVVLGPSAGAVVSATIQPIVSNDGLHWMPYGAAMVVASGGSPNTKDAVGTVPWAFFSAYVQAISGTGAKARCIMNA